MLDDGMVFGQLSGFVSAATWVDGGRRSDMMSSWALVSSLATSRISSLAMMVFLGHLLGTAIMASVKQAQELFSARPNHAATIVKARLFADQVFRK